MGKVQIQSILSFRKKNLALISPNITFEEIDETFIKKVRNYIDYDAKSNLPLSKYSYFNKFKTALRSTFDDGYLSINYATKIKSFDQAESQREYLTFEELQSLSKSPCRYEILKRAFLFSCLTGIHSPI
ncbi:phage integrase SAM-like domain-containing protein [Elizabethkingia anophelis]|nr:phage integrase SAM-like domain-containing protein [Elizabethkingia anophelis]